MTNTTPFINGVNYGNTFIPESFFADDAFYKPNGVSKVADQHSLCDLTGPGAQKGMTDWLDSMIKEQDFEEMQQMGVNFLRLPVGYWNVLDMPMNPWSSIESESERMGNLSKIMPDHTLYRPYIDKVFKYAADHDIQVMLDLHGAPGSQSGASNSGCSFIYKGVSQYYWDNELNKEWTIKAVVELAKICKDQGDTCYGVELLNEPATALPILGIDRWSLLDFYQKSIKASRAAGLPMEKPLVIMEWLQHWPTFWLGRWNHFFPEEEYGTLQLDYHIYTFMDSVFKEQLAWDVIHWPIVKLATLEVPVMIGEYTLRIGGELPTEQAQGWADWIQTRLHETGTIGSAIWLWNNKAHKTWSMRSMSTLETEGGINWRQTFGLEGDQNKSYIY